jgi:hypothetical protein
MARFLYEHPTTGELFDRIFPCGQAPRSIALEDGTVCERNLGAEIAGRGHDTPSCWPAKSRALAVHPTQRNQYMEFASKHGVPTHFDEMGRPVFESREHRKRYATLVGASDFDGGYGDPHCG